MKKRIFLLLLLLIIPSVTTISAYTIPSSGWAYHIGNVNYTVSSQMDFSDLNYSDSWIQFNDTRLNVTSENNINVTLIYLSDTSVNGIELINISVNTTSGNVTINIGGLRANSRHRVDMNGTTFLSVTSNSTGWISFNNSIWSERFFQVYPNYTGDTAPIIEEKSSSDDKEYIPLPTDLLLIMIVLFVMISVTCYIIITDKK